MVKKEDLATKTLYSFATPSEFETFLDREHQKLNEVFIKLAKKSTGIRSITAAEAVEVALCFGWIDGQGCGIDDQFWTTRFVPRRPKSMWSQKNVDTVSRLIDTGRMREAGLVAVQAAKDDGRWARAYAGPATITEPGDFMAELLNNPEAKTLYDSLNRTERYSVLWKIETASPSVRAKRIQTSIESLADGKRPPRPGTKNTPAAKVVKTTMKRKNAGPVKIKDEAVSRTKSFGGGDDVASRLPRRAGLRARS